MKHFFIFYCVDMKVLKLLIDLRLQNEVLQNVNGGYKFKFRVQLVKVDPFFKRMISFALVPVLRGRLVAYLSRPEECSQIVQVINMKNIRAEGTCITQLLNLS